MLLSGLIYIIVPLLLISIIAFVRQPGKLMWLVSVLYFGLVIAYLYATARWEIMSIYLQPVFPLLFVLASYFSYKRIRKPKNPPGKFSTILNLSINGILIIFFAGLNWFTFKGYTAPNDAIDLTSPLRNNNYVVLHSGASPFTNGHFHVRPQNHALDIVGLNAIGGRASSISGGPDLDAYTIYGDSLFSPCVGTVSIVVDEFEDLIPPKTDQKNLAGNHILIKCQGAEVLLAHFKKGSIAVKPGDQINPNSFLGQVGNTGNTSEPHLHIHAEQGGEPEMILNGKAVPFTIGGRYLVRGNIFSHK